MSCGLSDYGLMSTDLSQETKKSSMKAKKIVFKHTEVLFD